MSMFGCTGKLARVHLGNRTVTTREYPESFYRQYCGGRGLIASHLLREMEPGIDPFGPDNILIFACGLLTGHAIPGAGRHSIGAKSPLTGAYGEAEVGGYWGTELRKAGWDGLIVEGRSRTPVYLWIDDGRIEIRDAGHMWGMLTADCQEAIQQELGDSKIRVSQIGPGGERMVLYACITNDLHHFAGRAGLGAVMGSKNLKAVAVRGSGRLDIADKARVRSVTKWLGTTYKETSGAFARYGTGAVMRATSDAGGLPTRNFGAGSFDGVDNISAQAVVEQIGTGMTGCYACPIKCKKVVQVDGPLRVDPRYGGPEFETLAALGSNCGVSDLIAVAKANEICNAYTVDTISAGVAISFAMECYERGLITREDTDGVDLRFGNSEAMLTMVEKICRREGFGDLLGTGVAHMAEQIGQGSDDFALHVKGQALPMHEPRWKQALGLGYAVSPTGADHCHSIFDTAYAKEGRALDSLKGLGILEPLPAADLSPAKVRLLYYEHLWSTLNNSLSMCIFLPYSHAQIVELVAGVTGWQTSEWELAKIAERTITLTRLFNMREGFRRADDRLPKRLFEPLDDGSLGRLQLDNVQMEQALTFYYEMMGWDGEQGFPKESKLHELDISWAQDIVRGQLSYYQ